MLNRCGLDQVRVSMNVPNLLGKPTARSGLVSLMISNESKNPPTKTLERLAKTLDKTQLTFGKMVEIVKNLKIKTKAKNGYFSFFFTRQENVFSSIFYECFLLDNHVKSYIRITSPIDTCFIQVTYEGNFESMVHEDEILEVIKNLEKRWKKREIKTIYSLSEEFVTVLDGFNRITDYCFVMTEKKKPSLRVQKWRGLVGGLRPNVTLFG